MWPVLHRLIHRQQRRAPTNLNGLHHARKYDRLEERQYRELKGLSFLACLNV
jgi:hypothetical protein